MPLFQNSVLSKYFNSQNNDVVSQKWIAYKNHFLNPSVQLDIRNLKEEQYQGEFLEDLFVKILGYIKPASSSETKFNLTTEYKNVKDSKKADGAIIFDDKVKAVIELKGTNTTDLGKIEIQAFGYKNNQPDCVYVITSNFEKLRFYIDNVIEHVEFNLFTLTEEEFKLLYLCLGFDNLSQNVAKKIKEESLSEEDVITKKLYKDYSLFKRELHQNLVLLNPNFDPLELFKKSQKLLDRFLFLFFGEDRHLLPPNSVRLILSDWKELQERDVEIPLYERFKKYFVYLNVGYKGKRYDVFAYSGGLFQPDEILDNIRIDDDLLYKHTIKLAEYDFASEVDVNILGHIFENSLNELDEIKAQLDGQEIDKSKTKRKKDGVFYTPKYITKYIVENTVGKLCEEKKQELEIIEEEYYADKKRQKLIIQGLVEKLNTYRKWLLELTICDPACGSGAFLNQALDFLIEEHQYINELQAKLFGDALVMSDMENSILENNLFGVDLNEESVEIAKLSLWLRTAQPNRKLNDLNGNIKCGNSLIDDAEVAGEKAFNWQKEFPKVFENGGFDVIIGNPPYVQIQSMGTIANNLEKRNFKTFEKTGDLYCLFYELGNIILKKNGVLGFITSNKWLRANYGKSLRNYLIENTQPLELLDLGSGIFESATVDSNILIFEKNLINKKAFIGLDISKEKTFVDFTVFESKKVEVQPNLNDIWIISNQLESNIKTKFEQAGIPLKNWNIDINYGIKTGYNEAFVIDENVKENILKQCPKCIEILKPILKGRDICRYYANYNNLWLIYIPWNFPNTFESIKKSFIENEIDLKAKYPSVYEHLNIHKEKLLNRNKAETGIRYEWYALQRWGANYFNEFDKDKIIYQEMVQESSFSYHEKGTMFCLDTARIITGENLKYILCVLNTKLFFYSIKNFYGGGGLGESGVRMKHTFFENFPLVKTNDEPFIDMADTMLTLNKELQELVQKFQRTLLRKFELEDLPKKLQDWYKLSFSELIKELGKKKVILSLSQEAEWEDYFIQESKKALELKSSIDATDKTIDAMVYKLYGLNEEEIAIVEAS
jgi:type I restriction-modification system DNA methylase subunit